MIGNELASDRKVRYDDHAAKKLRKRPPSSSGPSPAQLPTAPPSGSARRSTGEYVPLRVHEPR